MPDRSQPDRPQDSTDMNEQIKRIGDRAKPAIKERGQDYFHKGHVAFLKPKNGGWYASVRGTGRHYGVRLGDLSREQPSLYCDCPAHDRYIVCKHVWATLLAIDEKLREESKAEASEADWRQFLVRTRSESAPLMAELGPDQLRLLLFIKNDPELFHPKIQILAEVQGQTLAGKWLPPRPPAPRRPTPLGWG